MNNIKICDAHVHFEAKKPVDETVAVYKKIIEDYNYDKMLIHAVPVYYGYSENYMSFYCKDRITPNLYASVGFCHHYNEKDTEDYYYQEIKKHYAMGCDAVKILDGKPDCYRRTKRGLDDKIYDKFFAFCEEKGLPVTMHIGDPASFWDWENATEIQKSKGWVYNEKDAPLEQLRSEAFNILKKFPELKMVFAHFNFMSEELERVEENFEKHKNLYLDLTPGVEMYNGFTKNYNDAKALFEKYPDRIIYGTDASGNYESDSWTHAALGIVRPFLEGTSEYINENIGIEPLKPFGFGEKILSKIYRDNFIKLYGENPRPLDYELIAKAIPEFMTKFKFEPVELENLKHTERYFKEKVGRGD